LNRGWNRRLGLGPVFVYEWVTSSRRWQAYALRSAFLLLVLLALLTFWLSNTPFATQFVRTQLVQLARGFFLASTGTMLAVVLLAAPAATAGAICVDRSRGTLAHMMVTDLSSFEIVLGKLAVRLVPVLALIACTFPVMELLTLMGGVDPDAIPGVFAVTVGVAVLGSSLALVFSLWVGKTHEALLLTYAVWGLWLLAVPISNLLGSIPVWPLPPLPSSSNPFHLAFAPYASPGSVDWNDYLHFLCGTLSSSAILAAVAVLRLRSVGTRDRVRRFRKPRAVPRGTVWRFLARNVPWLTPSLDRNPVAWREWHRSRLSWWGVVVASLYVGTCSLFTLVTIFWPNPIAEAAIINGLQASIGFLLLSVTAATSLAEERVRGSLDVLLATPLSSRQIVLGKWLGAYRVVPLLAILPCVVIAVQAYIRDIYSWSTQIIVLTYILSFGAAITSLGLAMATWLARLGRAVGMTVGLYVTVTVGAFCTLLMNFGNHGNGLAMASPFVWVGIMTLTAFNPDVTFNGFNIVEWGLFWTFVSAGAAIGLLVWIMADFERQLGRAQDVLARVSRPPFRVRIATTIYFCVAAVVFVLAMAFEPQRDLFLALTPIYFIFGKLVLCARAAAPLDAERIHEYGTRLTPPALFALNLVIARWLGAYRIVPAMVLLPALFAVIGRRPGELTEPPIAGTAMFMFLQSAAAVSLGLAVAAAISRRGLGIFWTFSLWALIEIGAVVAGNLGEWSPALRFCLSIPNAGANGSYGINSAVFGANDELWTYLSVWSFSYGVAAVVLLIAATKTLDRALGRDRASRPELVAAGGRWSRTSL
jgi:ABC-type transport system involved in multi-copper enzyme maturation permease subunit